MEGEESEQENSMAASLKATCLSCQPVKLGKGSKSTRVPYFTTTYE